jgi:hypothetical protein
MDMAERSQGVAKLSCLCACLLHDRYGFYAQLGTLGLFGELERVSSVQY